MAHQEWSTRNPDHLSTIKSGTAEFPICCSCHNLRKMETAWHWHNELELAVLMEGEAELCIESERYPLHAGDGYFVNASTIHSCHQTAGVNGPCRLQSISFHPLLVGGSFDSIFYQSYITPLIQNYALKGLALIQTEAWHKELLRLSDECWQACVHEEDGYEFFVRTNLSQAIFLLHARSANDFRPLSAREERNLERIRQMLMFIDAHYRDDLSVGVLASVLDISESEVMRSFHNMLGITPIQFIKNYRIRKAAELLLSTDKKIVDIAIDCGFQDMSYFARAFRETKGITPTDFRLNGSNLSD